MRTVACFFLVSLAAAACGGKVEDAGDAPSPAPGANAPSSTASGEGCARACDRIVDACDATAAGAWCVSSCRRDFADAKAARRYATCIEALSCEEIQRGLGMDYGPLGECWAKAHGR